MWRLQLGALGGRDVVAWGLFFKPTLNRRRSPRIREYLRGLKSCILGLRLIFLDPAGGEALDLAFSSGLMVAIPKQPLLVFGPNVNRFLGYLPESVQPPARWVTIFHGEKL